MNRWPENLKPLSLVFHDSCLGGKVQPSQNYVQEKNSKCVQVKRLVFYRFQIQSWLKAIVNIRALTSIVKKDTYFGWLCSFWISYHSSRCSEEDCCLSFTLVVVDVVNPFTSIVGLLFSRLALTIVFTCFGGFRLLQIDWWCRPIQWRQIFVLWQLDKRWPTLRQLKHRLFLRRMSFRPSGSITFIHDAE